MSDRRTLSQDKFDKLLDWLSPDRELAGIKYESIRLRLIKYFTLRGAANSDELADITIDRVIEKIESIQDRYSGDPALYFQAVAKNLHIDQIRYINRNIKVPLDGLVLPVEPEIESEISRKHAALEKCLKKLTDEERELIVAYYLESKGEKIKVRRQLAEEYNFSMPALHVRVFRLRTRLEKCIREALNDKEN